MIVTAGNGFRMDGRRELDVPSPLAISFSPFDNEADPEADAKGDDTSQLFMEILSGACLKICDNLKKLKKK